MAALAVDSNPKNKKRKVKVTSYSGLQLSVTDDTPSLTFGFLP
jgi:hypothetical protein